MLMSQYRHFRCKHLYCVGSVALFSKPIEIEICCLLFLTLNAPSMLKDPKLIKVLRFLFAFYRYFSLDICSWLFSAS